MCIFRVYGGRYWYRVYRNFVPSGGYVYDVYYNRRRLGGVWRFSDFNEAIDMAIAMAKEDINIISDEEEVE